MSQYRDSPFRRGRHRFHMMNGVQEAKDNPESPVTRWRIGVPVAWHCQHSLGDGKPELSQTSKPSLVGSSAVCGGEDVTDAVLVDADGPRSDSDLANEDRMASQLTVLPSHYLP